MRIFITGCVHGCWETVLNKIDEISSKEPIDLILVSGDSTTFRTPADVKSCSQESHRGFPVYGSFHLLWEGKRKLPCPMIIIGGNNECGDLFHSLPYGGYIMPGIFYAGRASIIDFNGIRISTISGITVDRYYQEMHEKLPLESREDKRSWYLVRAFSPFQLSCYSIFYRTISAKRIDVMMSHDWPGGIPSKNKKDFQIDDEKTDFLLKFDTAGRLGLLPFGEPLMNKLQPSIYTAAHHHYAYETIIPHKSGRLTQFKAVSAGYKEGFFRVVEIEREGKGDGVIRYAPEWIAILKSTQEFVENPSLLKGRILYNFFDKSFKGKEKEIMMNFDEYIKSGIDFDAIPYLEEPKDETIQFCKKFSIPIPKYMN